MQIDIRRPTLAGSEKDQIRQLYSFIYQLVDQLQYAFDNTESVSPPSASSTQIVNQTVISETKPTEISAQETFNAIKALIIKSADIVDAYYDRFNERLRSVYLAQSDFGEYKSTVEAEIEKTAESLTLSQEQLEVLARVFQDRDDAAYVVKNSGYVKTGFLSDGEYGIEVGQRTENNGVETFKGSARFTPGAIDFYDDNRIKAAWLSKRRLHAAEVEAVEKQKIGGFVDEVDTLTGDVTTRWVGKEI